MKLVIGGATGFVGRQVLIQALASPAVTSIVTIGRRPTTISESAKARVTDIVLLDGTDYSPFIKEKIADADVCVWTIAVPLTKSLTTPFDEVRRVTHDYVLAGIDALSSTHNTGKPLRFIYFSGAAANRDENASLSYPGMKEMDEDAKLRLRLRGKVESELVEYAAKNHERVEVCCVRPGYIVGDRGEGYVPPVLPEWLPTIGLEECVAAVLKQGIDGIEKDPLSNDEMRRIGQEVLGNK